MFTVAELRTSRQRGSPKIPARYIETGNDSTVIRMCFILIELSWMCSDAERQENTEGLNVNVKICRCKQNAQIMKCYKQKQTEEMCVEDVCIFR